MRLPPTRSTRTDTLCPYTTLFRSLFAEAQDLGIVAHELVRLFGETDVLSEVKEVVPVHPAIIAILQIAAVGHGQGAELPPMLTTNRSEEHTSELQSLMRISYAVFCLKKKKNSVITHVTNI